MVRPSLEKVRQLAIDSLWERAQEAFRALRDDEGKFYAEVAHAMRMPNRWEKIRRIGMRKLEPWQVQVINDVVDVCKAKSPR